MPLENDQRLNTLSMLEQLNRADDGAVTQIMRAVLRALNGGRRPASIRLAYTAVMAVLIAVYWTH